eukprot:m.5506 g.5506  ORF g.5506 m.5506 type:complete len:395 (+) comp2417_c0_seq1:232-1416(+)
MSKETPQQQPPNHQWVDMVEDFFNEITPKGRMGTTEMSNSTTNNVEAYQTLNRRIVGMESDINFIRSSLISLEKENKSKMERQEHPMTTSGNEKDKVEADIETLKQKIEQVLLEIRRELSSDRRQVAHRAGKSDRLITTVSQQLEETAGEVQALSQWRQSISEEVIQLQKMAQSGVSLGLDATGPQLSPSRQSIAAIEDRIRKQVDPKVNTIGQRITSLQLQMSQLKDANAQEFGRIDNQILTSINSTKEHVISVVGQTLSSMDTKLTLQNDRSFSKIIGITDRLSVIEKEMRSEMALFRQDISELRNLAKSNRDSVELAMSLLSEVEQLARANRNDLVRYNASMRDLMKQLFTHLSDNYVKPMRAEVTTMAKKQTKVQLAVKDLLEWRKSLRF